MAKETIVKALKSALETAQSQDLLPFKQMPNYQVERPPQENMGDFSTNVAMLLAKPLRQSPREIAEKLMPLIELPHGLLEKLECVGQGFVNFYLAPHWLQENVKRILELQESYGNASIGQRKKIQVEFVSANPNGPIHVGHGRGAAVGDALARLLEAIDYDVEREFYINDAGNQMRNFGKSLEARYLQLLGQQACIPEDGYHGEYVTELARALVEAEGTRYLEMTEADRLEAFIRTGEEKMLAEQRQVLSDFGVCYTTWFSELNLHDSGSIEKAISELRATGNVYENDGATWLKSTAFGDDKDRVLTRQNGAPTYLASDVAYHINKFARGYVKVIDIWGPDHHGYIARTKAAIQALGYSAERLDILVYQIVRLFSGGELVRMSKRGGELIPLAEVMEEVGTDACRFFFLMRSMDSHLDFDLDLAKKQSSENPVYYVQYAHARICSLFSQSEAESYREHLMKAQTDLLIHPAELSLMRKLTELPGEIEYAALNYQPHRMTRYAMEVASAFHGFYTECKVLGEEPELTRSRLALAEATRLVLAKALHLLGVSAPERM